MKKNQIQSNKPKLDADGKPKREIKVVTTNRKARHEYFFVDTYKAGIMLKGTEVKSIRAGKVSMSDAYCFFKNGELWVKNIHIAEYKHGGFDNHVPKGERKLLLKKRELKKLETKNKEKGLTIVPYEVFLSERDLIKVTVVLGKGKKAYDKRDSIKSKDMKREMDRNLKLR